MGSVWFDLVEAVDLLHFQLLIADFQDSLLTLIFSKIFIGDKKDKNVVMDILVIGVSYCKAGFSSRSLTAIFFLVQNRDMQSNHHYFFNLISLSGYNYVTSATSGVIMIMELHAGVVTK